jgi:uncharacterized protein YjbI with pentapeptide repeats
MSAQLIEINRQNTIASHQMIVGDWVASLNIRSQILAGSRILLSAYHHVTFSGCLFYATEIQDVTFENCLFDSCRFEFSHIRNCKFINCNFIDCSWVASTSTNCVYDDCCLDHFLSQLTEVGGNQVNLFFEHQLSIAC